MDPLTSVILNLVVTAVGFVVLYYVVRAAVVAGLQEDRRRQQQVAQPVQRSHLDADGL